MNTEEKVKIDVVSQVTLSPLAKKEEETNQALKKLDSFFSKPLSDGKAKLPLTLVSSIAKELEEEEEKETIENFKAKFKKLLINRKEFLKKGKEKKEEFEKTMIDFHTAFNKECSALMSEIEKAKAPAESITDFLDNINKTQ